LADSCSALFRVLRVVRGFAYKITTDYTEHAEKTRIKKAEINVCTVSHMPSTDFRYKLNRF